MIYNRVCEHCNNEFKAKMPHARFCGSICKQNYHKSKYKADKDQVLESMFLVLVRLFIDKGLSKGRIYELIDDD